VEFAETRTKKIRERYFGHHFQTSEFRWSWLVIGAAWLREPRSHKPL
jgi:hypothetical protein